MIFFLDTQERVVGHASNDAPQALPYKNDKLSEDLDTGAQTFEFLVPANHAESGQIREQGYVITQGFEGELLQFQIASVDDVHDSEGLHKRIYCEFAWSELNGHIVRPYDLPSADAVTATTYALSGTRWQVGKIDFAGVRDLSSDNYDTALKMLQDIKEAFSGDIRFYVTMKGTKVTGRFVDLVQQVGANRGKTITFDKNIQSARRIFDRTTVATALIGLGRGDTNSERLTFTQTVWNEGVNGAPISKPAGQDWIGDPDALRLWGVDGRHITKVFEYDTTNPNVLLQKTWEELQRIKSGVYQYEVEAAFLDALGWDWERSAIGDTVQIMDHLFEPPLMLSARIVQLERSKSDPNANKMVLGDYLPRMSRAQDIMEIQTALMKNYEKWGSGGMTILRQLEAPAGDPNTLWIKPGLNFDVVYTWDPDALQWVESAPLTAGDLDAQDQIFIQDTPPPHLLDRLWLDTTVLPYILKRSTGSEWREASPTKAADVGADPAGSADAAKQAAEQAANDYTETYAEASIIKQAAPPAHLNGRLWLQTDVTPNILWRSDGSAWTKATATLPGEVGAEGTVFKQATAPAHAAGRLWLDTSLTPNVLRRSTGTAWVNASPTTAGEIGAETPTAAQNKAKVAEYRAYKSAAYDQAQQILKLSDPIRLAPAGQYTATIKNNIISAYNNLVIGYDDLAANIDASLSDGIVTASEESLISSFKTTFETRYEALAEAIAKATQDAQGLTVGNINILGTAKIGDAIYLGDQLSTAYKYVNFNNTNRIYSDGVDTFIDSDGDININSYGMSIFSDGGSFYMQGSFLSVEFTNVEFAASPVFSTGASFYGTTEFYSATGTNRLYWDGVNLLTNVPETGFCGVGAYNSTAYNGNLAGVGVNFRVKKTYVPSSISVAGTSSNLVASTNLACIDISANGFWLYITSGSTAISYRYWRGTYTA